MSESVAVRVATQVAAEDDSVATLLKRLVVTQEAQQAAIERLLETQQAQQAAFEALQARPDYQELELEPEGVNIRSEQVQAGISPACTAKEDHSLGEATTSSTVRSNGASSIVRRASSAVGKHLASSLDISASAFASHILHHDDLDSTGQEELTIEESIWGAAILVGTDVMGGVGSVFMSALFLINCIMQATFIYVIATTDLSQPEYIAEDVVELRHWRRRVAHAIENFDRISDLSLASRVCTGDSGLSVSTSQSGSYAQLDEYIGHGDHIGTLMLSISLFAWYLTVAIEVNNTFKSMRLLSALTVGSSTRTLQEDDKFHLLHVTWLRQMFGFTVGAARLVIAALMMAYGAFFLIYDISIDNLIMNAVALEFVLTIDELIYDSCAPLRVRDLLGKFAPFTLKRCEWQGMDFQAGFTVVLVSVSLISVFSTVVVPQQTILREARDALCAGDVDFVYTIDGAGTVTWGYPDGVSRPILPLPAERPEWKPLDPATEYASFSDYAIDFVLRGAGRLDDTACPVSSCYNLSTAIPAPNQDATPCCLARQTRSLSIVTGKLSIYRKSIESTVEANAIWNPGCYNLADSIDAFNTNIIRGSLEEALRERSVTPALADSSACGDLCPPERPICEGGVCVQLQCRHAEPYCNQSSVAGLRSRQVCPVTCGCHQPRGSLALSLPEDGCPERCITALPYKAALQALPCEDAPVNDPELNAFLDSWEAVSYDWPADWRASAFGFIWFIRLWGCDYLTMTAEPAGWQSTLPANYNGPLLFWLPNFALGMNPCVEHGFVYPIKPLSYFCPASCGCRAGDKHCSGQCPVDRNTSRPALRNLDPREPGDEYIPANRLFYGLNDWDF